MIVISPVQSKGGTGKSTVGIQLATTATCLLGLRTAIVDTDPQGSATKWAGRRAPPLPLLFKSTPARLQDDLRQLRSSVDLCIVDTSGHDLAALSQAAVSSNLTVVATRPTELDREAAVDVISALRQFGLPHVVLLTQAPHRSSAKFRLWVDQYAQLAEVMDPVLTTLNAFQDSIVLGLGVEEYEPNGRAAEEVRAALDWILRHINGARQ